MNTPTELSRPGLSPTVPMPRMRATPAPASDDVEETSSDGETWLQLANVALRREFSSVSAVIALTASGTSDSASLRRVAVTTMSLVSIGWFSTAWLSTAAASAVAPSVGCADALIGIGFLRISRNR